MKVDYLIIGSGLSGLVLRRSLATSKSVVMVDPEPGAWKIGEANVPEMFATAAMAEIAGDVKQLPSFSKKNGSVFINDDSVTAYPIVSNPKVAMHVARDELEQLLLTRWAPSLMRERVLSIDVPRKQVRTTERVYDVAEQIIDCSGPAMLVASALNEVSPLWPIHSSWRYYDVEGLDADAFWRHLRATGRSELFVDIPNIRLFSKEAMAGWQPYEATNLTRVSDGVWMWQIPLFRATRLSVGLVSRWGPVDLATLDATTQAHAARCFALKPRPLDGPTIYDRFHQRSGFARRAARAATMDYVLVGDAFTFVDPVYSVGTSLAVNKALELAQLLNDGGWTPPKCEQWCTRYEALLAKRIEGFRYWYFDDNRAQDPNTAKVKSEFPQMTTFQAAVTWQYARVVEANLKLTTSVGGNLFDPP